MVEKVEDKEFERIQATGKYVVLKCVKIVEKESVIKTAGGIIIPGQESKNTGREVNTGQEKVKVNMYIDSVGDRKSEKCLLIIGRKLLPLHFNLKKRTLN